MGETPVVQQTPVVTPEPPAPKPASKIPEPIKKAVQATKSTLAAGMMQAVRTAWTTIVAIAVVFGLIVGGAMWIRHCGGTDPNETGNHDYQSGESKTDYKPSPELKKFLDESDDIIATYRKWAARQPRK